MPRAAACKSNEICDSGVLVGGRVSRAKLLAGGGLEGGDVAMS
jgi:hypothetical protein